VTAGLGALVVRAFERGERVHLAMACRGYTATLPTALTGTAAPRRAWAGSLAVPTLAAIGLALA
jgi:cobalt/nickel transport system permease protein